MFDILHGSMFEILQGLTTVRHANTLQIIHLRLRFTYDTTEQYDLKSTHNLSVAKPCNLHVTMFQVTDYYK